MLRTLTLAAVAMMIISASTAAESVQVTFETDKSVYNVGEDVNWSVSVWADPQPTVAGISLVFVELFEDRLEELEPADTEFLMGVFWQLTGTHYGVENGFFLNSAGDNDPPDGYLTVWASQTDASKMLGVGNDGTPHLFAAGSYAVHELGMHTLATADLSISYWPATGGNPLSFDNYVVSSATFEVVPEPATMMSLLGGCVLIVRFTRRSGRSGPS